MARRPEEQAIIDRFAMLLATNTGRQWQPSATEVPTLKNDRKYDCEFTCPGKVPIAAEIASLFPLGSHQEDRAKRDKFARRLRSELEREGIGGLMLEIPVIQKKHRDAAWYRTVAVRLRKMLAQQTCSGDVEFEGFRFRRIADNAAPSSFYNYRFSGYEPSEAAGAALATLLSKKNDQLDVDAHRRILIAVNDGCRASAMDVLVSCAFIDDFHRYPNFDHIYFEESPGDFQLVFDRSAYFALEAGRLPNDIAGSRLVACWLEARLAGHWPRALDTALRISWDRGGTDWLSNDGRVYLELESHMFLQECPWKAPKRYWELLRGPMEVIGDGRRRARPISAAR
jgi:hypothetical protein